MVSVFSSYHINGYLTPSLNFFQVISKGSHFREHSGSYPKHVLFLAFRNPFASTYIPTIFNRNPERSGRSSVAVFQENQRFRAFATECIVVSVFAFSRGIDSGKAEKRTFFAIMEPDIVKLD